MKKPTDKKEFETMVRDCAEIKFTQYFTLLGRDGQAQYGGDVSDLYEKIIIQCKCYDQNKGKDAYDRFIEKIKENYKEACGHYQSMELFVAATTLNRDLPTQETIHKIAGSIPIQTMFWEDIAPLNTKFEEKYRLQEIQVALDEALIRDRDNHPSFRLLQIDDLDLRLFPSYEGQVFEPQTEENGSVSPIWSKVRETWQDNGNRSVVIEGAGGIGKTVALFSLTKAKAGYTPAPAIYIPMYRLVDENSDCVNLPKYFAEKFPALHSKLDLVTQRTWEEGPKLLLLLDGFNEVPNEKRRTILRQINDWRKSHPGAQLIVVSRPMDNLDLEHALAADPLALKLKALDLEQARAFLTDHGLSVPPAGPIWEILSYPLFLILYAKTGCLPQETSSGYPLAVREAASGGALIWNYLQRELLRDDREDMETWVLRCAVACEYILPRIAYEIRHPRKSAELTAFPWIEVILQETGLLSEQQDKIISSVNERAEKRYNFLHQNFRDCLAGIYLVNQAEMSEKSCFPDVFRQVQSHLALNYTAELITPLTFDHLWEANRKEQQPNNVGTRTNHIATCNLLELCKRNEGLRKEVNFSGMDLRGLSLTHYLGKDGLILPLFFNSTSSINTHLDRSVFESKGHSDSIKALSVLPDGRVVSGSKDSTLLVWDATSCQCLQTLEGHSGAVNCVTVLSNGQVVSGSSDSTLRVWDVTTGQCLQTLRGHKNSVCCVVELPDGSIVSGSDDCTLRVWNPSTGQCLHILEEHSKGINCVTILKNGSIVSGSRDNTIRVWNVSLGKCLQLLIGHTNYVNCVTVLPDGHLISGSGDGTLRIWDTTSGCCLQTLHGHTSYINCVAVLPNGDIISGANDRKIMVWDITSGQCLQVLEGNTSSINCIAVLPDGLVLSGANDSSMRVWDPASGQCLQTLEGHNKWVNGLAVLPNMNIVSGSDDRTLRIWDIDSGQCLQKLEGHKRWVNCVAVLSDGRVVSGSGDKTLRVWDTFSGHCLHVLEGHSSYVNCIAVFPDGRVVSGSYDSTLRVWDSRSGRCINILHGHRDAVHCVAILPDGRIISGSNDKTLKIWDVDTGQCQQTLEGHNGLVSSIAVLQNGHVISGSYDRSIRVWDIVTGNSLQLFERHKGCINCVVVLPNGLVVSGANDHSLRVWDIPSGKCLQNLEGHTERVNCAVILQDGRLVSSSDDNTLRVWNQKTGECLDVLEAMEVSVSRANEFTFDFSEADITPDLARLLWHNGGRISIKDYECWVKPYRKANGS